MKLRNITRERGKGVFLCISGADHGVQWLRIQDTLKKTWTQYIFAFHKMDIRKELPKTTQMI